MELLISFPDQSQSFTLGVEYGRILEKIEKGEEVVTNNGFSVRKENMELLIKTCNTFGYSCIFGTEYYEWIEFTAFKITSSKN